MKALILLCCVLLIILSAVILENRLTAYNGNQEVLKLFLERSGNL